MSEIQSLSFQVPEDTFPKTDIQDSRVRSRERKLDIWPGLLTWPLILARQRISWSPALILGELWQFLFNIGAHLEMRRLLKLQPLAEITERNPRLAFKHVIPNYLARGFTVNERASCVLHHYRRMLALPESVLHQILQRHVALHEIAEGGNCFAFTLGLPEAPFDKEGELSLNMQVDGKIVFNLSFTIVPGWVVKSEAPEALLISRLQGIPGCNSQIRLARRALNDYSPRTLLLAALQGVADALRIGEIAAVCATNQRCYSEGCATSFKNGYDGFFTKAGMVRLLSASIPALFRLRANLWQHLRRAQDHGQGKDGQIGDRSVRPVLTFFGR